MENLEIYCPKCEWEPQADDRWGCKCGHSWNTFDTYGKCPNCGYVWRDTQCLSCIQWSKHHDWYHNLPSVDALMDEVAEVIEQKSK